MFSSRSRPLFALISPAIGAAAPALAQLIGPSTAAAPYLLPSRAGVSTTSLLTVGDQVGGYTMVGIPDGLGAFDGPGDSLTLMMNHELGFGVGAVRAHGAAGAFVSRWEIDKTDLSVTSGRDHNTAGSDVHTWNGAGYTQGTAPFGRFCSADLAAPGAFRFGDLGTDARILTNGEEVGAEGRSFAHILTGADENTTWQLPRLGRFSWENAVPSPYAQQKTIVVGTDDSSPGQVYVYVGEKTDAGNDIERAGLTNGALYGVQVSGFPTERRMRPANGAFDLFDLGNVENLSGASLNSQSNANDVTNFRRPEDGAWDPRPGHENNFYFVTSDTLTSGGGRSRLYRMTFDDLEDPLAGGTVTALLEGEEGHEMFDNLTIDTLGRVLIQEDPGSSSRLAKLWLYDSDTGGVAEVAAHNANFFTPGAADFLTTNEESSGILDAANLLGPGWFLLDVQAHYGLPGEQVEGGQLLALYVDPAIVPEPGPGPVLLALATCVPRRRSAGRRRSNPRA